MKLLPSLLCGILFTIMFVGGLVGAVYAFYSYERDISGYWEKAVTSPNADLMLEHLDRVLNNYEELGFTEGHTVYLLKTPKNDLTLIFEQLNDYRHRLETIASMDETSFEYQKALEEVTESMILFNTTFNLTYRMYGIFWLSWITIIGFLGASVSWMFYSIEY